jgi:hypothetical protein
MHYMLLENEVLVYNGYKIDDYNDIEHDRFLNQLLEQYLNMILMDI